MQMACRILTIAFAALSKKNAPHVRGVLRSQIRDLEPGVVHAQAGVVAGFQKRQLVGFELLWDVRLVLKGDEVPKLSMQGKARLGRTTWLGRKTPHPDRGELHLHPSRLSAQPL